MHVTDSGDSRFTTPELARLEVYKRAVAAGFYSDWDGSTNGTDTRTLAWLGPPAPLGYPFTADELARLELCRAAVAAGYFTDELAVV